MKKKNNKIILVAALLLLISWNVSFAQEAPPSPPEEELSTEESAPEPEVAPPLLIGSIIITDGDQTVNANGVPLPEEGTVAISDTGGDTRDVNARSVLALLYGLDQNDDGFQITQLVYYSSFGAFYLKCISLEGEEKCDNWLYKVDGETPSVGMDNFILSGGENVEVYFGSFFEEPREPTEDPPEPEEESPRRSRGSRRKTPEPAPEIEAVEPVAAIPVAPAAPIAPVVVAVAPSGAGEKISKPAPAPEKVAAAPEPLPFLESPTRELPAAAAAGGFSVSKPLFLSSLLVLLFAWFLGWRTQSRR